MIWFFSLTPRMGGDGLELMLNVIELNGFMSGSYGVVVGAA